MATRGGVRRADGMDCLERYRRIEDGTKPDYALIQFDSINAGNTGKVDLVGADAIRSEKGGPARSVAVIVRSERLVGKVCRAATTPRRTSISSLKNQFVSWARY